MSQTSLSPAREHALRRLLDDPAPKVRDAVRQELQRHGAAGVAFLQRVLTEPATATDAAAARDLMAELAAPEPAEAFARFITSLEYELETGLLLLNRVAEPALDVVLIHRQLDVMARRVTELAPAPASPRETCRALNRVLFHEYGLRGNAEAYEDPRNSFLSSVLERQRGLPLTLCALYIMVAQRVGLELEPVGLPDHFLVGCYAEDEPFFIDAFAQGRFLTPDQLVEPSDVAPLLDPAPLPMPTPVGEVLARACRNLVRHYTSAGQPERARLFARFVRMFAETHQPRP